MEIPEPEERRAALAEAIHHTPLISICEPVSGPDWDIYQAYLTRKEGWRQKTIDWAMTKLPAQVHSPDGDVAFTRSSLRNALAHGKGKLKILTAHSRAFWRVFQRLAPGPAASVVGIGGKGVTTGSIPYSHPYSPGPRPPMK